MKNFLFISPNFPENYWMFCRELKKNGLNVLGIGDQPYEELSQGLKDSLDEYYKVSSLENEEEVYRAVAFLIFKHGRIDWLESNNEYWLERDARLRTAFHITSGFQEDDIPRIKYKSRMKEYYARVGIPTARYHLVDTMEGCRKFIEEVGYPVVVKPDNGVGASHTYRLENQEQLEEFMQTKEADVSYIMEEFVFAEVNSYDAIIDSHGNPIFETGNVIPGFDHGHCKQRRQCDLLYCEGACRRYAVRQVVPRSKSFNVRSRFVHFEFFRLAEGSGGTWKEGRACRS